MKHPSTKLLPLEFAVFKQRPQIGAALLGETHCVLAAVSGGADSVALLHVLTRLQQRWGFALEIAYVHHGLSKSESINRYRSRTGRLVETTARTLDLPFHALKASKVTATPKESEEHLRELRHGVLGQQAEKSAVDLIAMGHHADDLFETRLIRLMRGTGPQGLAAMSIQSENLWRPLLGASRLEIETYLAARRLKKGRDWIDDPSNRDARYLRNAIRKQLIPKIEKLRPGGVKAMARSLQQLSDAVFSDSNVETLDRAELLSLAMIERRSRLSQWAFSRGLRGISSAHIEEILKRIDTPKKRLTFKTAGLVWQVDNAIRVDSSAKTVSSDF